MTPAASAAAHTRILSLFGRCTEDEKRRGREFYLGAHDICASLAAEFNVDLDRVAGVMAALSPNNSWASNRKSTRLALEERWDDLLNYKRDVFKARCIMAYSDPVEGVLRGPKTIAFYRLLRDGGNRWDVCVDGHMANLVRGTQPPAPMKGIHLTARQSADIADCFRAVCYQELPEPWRPCDLQATLWLAWRASAGTGMRQGRIDL